MESLINRNIPFITIAALSAGITMFTALFLQPIYVIIYFFLGLWSLWFWFNPFGAVSALLFFCLPQELIASLLSDNVAKEFLLLRNADEILILSFLIMTAVKKFRLKIPWEFSDPLIYCTLGILLSGFLSSFKENVPLFISVSGSYLFIKGILLFFVCSQYLFTTHQLKRFLNVVVGFTVIVIVLSIIELFDPNSFHRLLWPNLVLNYERAGIIPIQTIFGHPGDFGWFMALISVFAFGHFIVFSKKRYLVLFTAAIAGVFFSLRRKPLIGILLGSGAGIVAGSKMQTKIPFVKIITGVLSFSFLVYLVAGDIIYTLVVVTVKEYFSESSLYHARNILALGSVKISMDYFPLGVGFGRYGSWMSWVYYSPIYFKYGLSTIWGLSPSHPNFIADTFWPMVLGETGIIGFISYLLFFVFLIKKLWKGFSIVNNIVFKAFVLSSILVLLEGLTESIALPIFSKSPQAYWVLGIAGIGYGLLQQTTKNIRLLPS